MKTTNRTDREENASDRGYADYYYYRGRNPHIRVNFVKDFNLSQSEINAYNEGYDEAAKFGDRKRWD